MFWTASVHFYQFNKMKVNAVEWYIKTAPEARGCWWNKQFNLCFNFYILKHTPHGKMLIYPFLLLEYPGARSLLENMPIYEDVCI